MVLYSDIENAYASQQTYVSLKEDHIERAYLRNYTPDLSHIEVITGIRRCGKSTLLQQIRQKHFSSIAYFNFEDSRVYNFELSDFQKLDQIIGTGVEAYFFDEIQNVPSWEVFVRQLHDRNEKVFITGSNASLLSKELGTRLTGRHIRHELFPFSYLEFLEYKKETNSPEALSSYLDLGGFPEFLASNNPEILQHLLRDIVLRDIAVRYGIRNTNTLMEITLFLISNIGKEFSYNKIRKNFAIGSANTVSDYVSWLEDSYIFFLLPRFSWSVKNTTINPRKIYGIDPGLIFHNSLSFSDDKGRLLENAVYLYLRRKGYTLYYYRENKECDFVVFENKQCKAVIQVCSEINSDNMKREVDGLIEAIKFFTLNNGIIVTQNQKDEQTSNNLDISLIPANEFLTQW
jgi:hypothetical protein